MKRCTECGKPGAETSNRDAANKLHHWHHRCLAEFRWWVAGHTTPLPKRYVDAAKRGEQLDMPTKRWEAKR